jgi:putative chitinase
MKLDRESFFTGYRREFGTLTQSQVAGLNALLDAIEEDQLVTDRRHIAYMLATTKHECGDTWQPIIERGSREYFNRYNAGTSIGKNLGNTQPGDGWNFRGRGYVQLTGRANYGKLSKICEVDLLANPDRACDPGVAYMTMSHGFRNGTFTGKKITDYINTKTTDYRQARRCINGLDQCDKIAAYATAFDRILSQAEEPPALEES